MMVMKFGGTSLASGREIKRVVEIVNSESGGKVVVVSAMAGVTNNLVEISKRVINLPTAVVRKEVDKFHQEILEKYMSTAEVVIGGGEILDKTKNDISELAEDLKTTLLGVGYLEDLSPKSLDYILSFGERFSVLLLSGAFNASGVNSMALTGYEAGILTDSRFGHARPILRELEHRIKDNLGPLLGKKILPVVTGFIAADKNGTMTTMGRGGSDYTASLIARYLGADEVQIWTDVDGILTADPKIVKSARLIPALSHIEAVDLAYFGAKVIHPKMIEPAMDADISVIIKNTFNPQGTGTVIVREQEKAEGVIKAVTMHKDVGIVNLKGVGMAEIPDIPGRLFTTLGDNNISPLMISGSLESNLSFVIKKEFLNDVIGLLNENFVDNGIRELELIEDVCIVAVVGVGMHGTKGLAAEIFKTVADEDANIIMIAQGSSEVNISFMVNEEDGGRVVKALHKTFIE